VTPYEIPLSPEPQEFAIDLAGLPVAARLAWCRDSACWCLDLLDAAGAELLVGLPVVSGCDLLGQHPELGIGGALLAQTDHDADAAPTFDNLGTSGRLYFVVSP
jgi:hypothetical protein